MHVLAPVAEAKVPEEQLVQALADAPEYWPGMHELVILEPPVQ